MKHIDLDTIYKFELGLLNQKEIIDFKNHIARCAYCMENLNKVKNEIAMISSFNPNIDKSSNPLTNSKTNSLSLLKRAAVIIIGMLITYTAIDNFVFSEKIVVSGQKLIPQNSSMDSLELFETQNVDLYNDF